VDIFLNDHRILSHKIGLISYLCLLRIYDSGGHTQKDNILSFLPKQHFILKWLFILSSFSKAETEAQLLKWIAFSRNQSFELNL